MLSNYFKLAVRNLFKNRLYSALNISGLAIGIAGCLLILLYVNNELSYDRWNPQAERIVRPTYEIKINGFNENHGSVDAVVGPEAAASLPEIEAWCRIQRTGALATRRDGQAAQYSVEEKVFSVDSSFFVVFPLKILAGDPLRCLNQPDQIAISRSRAEYYFASVQQALGQILVIGKNNQRQQVSAVFEDIPENTHFHADLLLPLMANPGLKNASPYWGYNNQYFTYLLLRKGADKAAFAKKFDTLASSKVSLLLKDLFATTIAEFEQAGQKAQFQLQNLPDIHLYSAKQSELEANGNIRYVWIFGAIAFFILLIACINFMNLATARSAGRAREVGVRKVLGSSRMALAGQFLTESVALSAISVGLAVGIATAVLPAFNELSARNLTMPWSASLFWLVLLVGTIMVGLLAGSYPAFFLSSFNSIKVLKGMLGHPSGGKGGRLRNGLVVFQFAISTVLIVSTILVYSQLRFIQMKNLGFDKSQVLMVDNAHALGDRAKILQTEMLENAQIENATMTNYLPLPNRNRENCILSTKKATGEGDKVFQRWWVDEAYVRTLGLKIKLGRDFDPGRVTDSLSIIINETAAKELGFADPIGQKLYTSRTKSVDSKTADFDELTIVGVLEDFHYESLHDKIGGLFLQFGHTNGTICLRMKGADAAPVIASLEQKWQKLAPDRPLQYHFMDESVNRMYESEQRIGFIALIFSMISVLVSCLGLFGLAVFTTEQRTKEIGVRKVLGASVASITRLLASDFLQLVAIAFVIASPVAYYFMDRWLADFAYRIDIQWWMFVLAGLIALSIAFLTVSFQSVRAALRNPVESLRSE